MNAEISETIRPRLLRFGMQIPELLRLLRFGVQIPELLLLRFGVQIPELLTRDLACRFLSFLRSANLACRFLSFLRSASSQHSATPTLTPTNRKIPELLTQRKFVSVETNLRCIRSSGTCTPNLNSLAPIVSKISAFIRTDRQTDIDSANDPDQEYLYPLLEE